MIKPTELRLGNWIKKYESGWDFKQVTASDIAELEATPPHAEDMRFQPILLTPDVLERCGFEKCSCGGWKNEIHIENDLTFKSSFGKRVEVKHLHQLQNIIHALTSEELQINL